MARSRAFNLTAEINLRGPTNIGNIVSDIRRQLTGITVDITPRINAQAMRNVTTLNTNLQTLNRTFQQTQRSAADATTAIRNFGQAINSIGNAQRTLTQAAAATQTLNNGASNAARSIGVASTQMQEFGRQSALAVRRFAAFSLVTGAIYSFTGAISKGIQGFIDFDKEFVRLQQVTGQSAAGLKDLSAQISALSTSLGVSSAELTTVSVTLAQAGLSARDTEKALKALALSSLAPSFDDMNQTVEGSIALMRQFGIGASDLESALGSINAVAAQFAVEASDLIVAIQRTGGVFATAGKGVSEGKDALNEFLAVFTSIRATTRESAETIATGLRTIFTRIQRADTVDALKQLGIELRDMEGKFVGPYEAVRRLSEGLSKIDPRSAEFAKISEELGGFRQVGKVIPLIQQFAVAQNALAVAQKGSGSLAKDAGTAQLALANQIAKVREEFLALIRSVGESESFRSMISIALQFASALIKIADAVKIVLPALTAMAAFKGLQALTQFGAGFMGGIRGGGARRANGGYIGAYASGGLVPGSGDGDTVPAMLTPGEFVIRKKAVQAIGASNLHAVNGYAGGGLVNSNKNAYGTRLPANQIKYALNLSDAQWISADTQQRNVWAKEYAKTNPKTQLTKKQKAEQKLIANGQPFGLVGLYGGSGTAGRKGEDKNKTPLAISYGSLTPSFADKYETIMTNGIKKTIATVGGSMARRVGATPLTDQNNIDKVLKKAGIETAIGTLTEASISIAGAPFNNDIGKQNDSMDFPRGLGSIASLFGIASNIPTDATRDVKGKGISRFVNQISRYLDKTNLTGIETGIASNITEQPTTARKNMGGRIQKFAVGGEAQAIASQMKKGSPIANSWWTGTFAGNNILFDWSRPTKAFKIPTGEDIEIEQGFRKLLMDKAQREWMAFQDKNKKGLKQLSPEERAKLATATAMTPEAIAKIEKDAEFRKAQAEVNRTRNFKGDVEDYGLRRRGPQLRRFAGGGSAEDTVPALLTPGEFVINKEAASKLGSATLNKLNHADKISGFNSGGSVGYIQKFANGGGTSAKALGIDPRNAARVNAAIAKNADAFEQLKTHVKGWPIDKVGNALVVLTRSLEKGATQADAVAKASSGITGNNDPRGNAARKLRGTQALIADSTPETRTAKSVGYKKEIFMSATGFAGQDVTKKALTSKGTLQKGFIDKASAQASKQLADMGLTSKVAEKALLTFNVELRKTGNAQTAMQSAMKSATTSLSKSSFQTPAMRANLGGGGGLFPTFNKMGMGKVGSSIKSFGSSLFSGQMIQDPNGPAGQMMKKGLFRRPDSTGMVGMGLTMVGGAAVEGAASLAGGEKTATGRAISNVGGDIANYAAMGAMLGSMIPGVGTALGGLAGAAVGAVTGIMKLEKANREAAESAQRDKTETTREQSAKNVEQYSIKASQVGISNEERNRARTNAVMGLRSNRSQEQTLADVISQNAEAEGRPGFFGSRGLAEEEAANERTVKEISEARQGTAQQAEQILATDMISTGKSFKELQASMNKTSEGQQQFKMLTEDMANADKTYINLQESRNREIKDLRSEGRDEEANALQENVNKDLDGLRLRIAERNLAEENARVAAENIAKEQEKLSRAINRATVSLLKSFGAIDQSFNRTAMVIGQLANKRSEILTGKKSLTSNQFTERADIFKNPLAYSREDRQGAINQTKGMFGPIGDVIDNAINAVEDAKKNANFQAGIMGGNDPNSEAGRQAAKKSLLESMRKSGGVFGDLGPVLEANIEEAFKNAKPEDTLDDIIEKALGPAGEIGQKAMELFGKANEEAAKALGELAQTSQAYADITTKNIARTASLFEMQAGSRLQQQEALGIKVTPQEKLNARLVGMQRRLGFGNRAVNTANIVQTRASLVDQQKELKQQQAGMEQRALAGGQQEQQELINFQTRLAGVNNRLETMDTELQNLPQVLEQSIGDLIGEMQKRVSMLEARKEAGAGFAEKLVTSTPQELRDLNNTYALLNNTLQGNITTINDSRVAQEAYFQALREGKTPQEAMNNAQAAFANENKKALSMFNELAQVSGLQGPEMDKMRADLIENLAASTGQNNNPLIQNILAQLREDPQKRAERDPVLIALKGQAEALRQEQVRAVEAANEIDRNKQAELLTQVSQKILEAFTNVANMIQSALQSVAQATGGNVLGGGTATTPASSSTTTNKPQGATQQKPTAATSAGFKPGPSVTRGADGNFYDADGRRMKLQTGNNGNVDWVPDPAYASAGGGRSPAPAAGGAPAPAAGGGALAPIDVNARPNDAATRLLPGSRVGIPRPGTIGGISLTQQASNARVEQKKRTRERQLRAYYGAGGFSGNRLDAAVQRQLDKEDKEGEFKDTGIRGLEDAQADLRQAQQMQVSGNNPITMGRARTSTSSAVRNVLRSQREEARLARGANFRRQQEERKKQLDYQRQFGPAIRAGLMSGNYKDFERQQQANAGPAGAVGGMGMVAPAAPVAGAAGVPVAGAGAAPGVPGAGAAPGVPGAGAAPGVPGAAGAAPALSPEVNMFLQSLTAQVNGFGKYVEQLSRVSLPNEITFNHTGTVDVRITGAEALNAFREETRTIVDNAVAAAMARLNLQTEGGVGAPAGNPKTTGK